jgi:hypothetical protein
MKLLVYIFCQKPSALRKYLFFRDKKGFSGMLEATIEDEPSQSNGYLLYDKLPRPEKSSPFFTLTDRWQPTINI